MPEPPLDLAEVEARHESYQYVKHLRPDDEIRAKGLMEAHIDRAALLAVVRAQRAALEVLTRESESFVNLTRTRGGDLRPEAAQPARNAIASAKIVLTTTTDGPAREETR